ncbi:DUF4169 family protein [Pseudorhodobacter sp. W20_MBD10_FR17]|uniref:DUF4169 family protein n=1 Tax=Pseudorhodobacter sp. W20_MBD10_FR17 TaxID=3240266 RepID=UPI003F96ADF6
MAEIINLRSVKKAKAKAGTRAQADANAAKFGRTKAEKLAEAARKDKVKRVLDGHALDPDTKP